MSQLEQFSIRQINGQPSSFKDYNGKVLLIVNVASKCGLTPQYEGLEKTYEKYRDQGFLVMGFPANEFGAQEPGTNQEINQFCSLNYGVQFPMFEKVVVKGEGQHPLFKYLTDKIPNAKKKSDSTLEAKLKEHGLLSGKPHDIMWNFEKFLVNRKGDVVARFAPDVEPGHPMLVEAIEAELAKD